MKAGKGQIRWSLLMIFALVGVVACAQSPTGSLATSIAPQVRPALPPEQSPKPSERDIDRTRKDADRAKLESQAQADLRLGQETHSRGYWVDPDTNLMWEGQDSGITMTWHKAAIYCRNLHLAGYPDIPTGDWQHSMSWEVLLRSVPLAQPEKTVPRFVQSILATFLLTCEAACP